MNFKMNVLPVAFDLILSLTILSVSSSSSDETLRVFEDAID